MAPQRNKRRETTRRRASSTETENPVIVDAELAKGKFRFIYRNSYHQEILVKHCFPLFKARSICESAIRALMREFDVDETGMVGYSTTGGLKIVVKMPKGELALVKEYLMSQGMSESESTEKAFGQGIVWYGIVDGLHVHRSLMRLESSKPDPFLDFKWIVAVIEWQPMHTLKAFARARNILQSTNVVSMTLFDTLSGLNEIAQEKARLSGDSIGSLLKRRGAISEIADEFSGGSRYAEQTTRTLAGAELRIKSEALEVLGRILNEENATVTRRMLEKTVEQVPGEDDIFDTRAYKNIISTNTIRGATTFLNAEARDQSNALLKLRNAFENNSFKCFQAARLNKETERSARAHHQIQLMNDLMGREAWPEELSDVERKLLMSPVFDSELDKHDMGTDTIMPCLVTEYRVRMPLEAGIRWRLYSRDRQNDLSDHTDQDESTSADASQAEGQSQSLTLPSEESSQSREFQETCPLERLNITCLNMDLERFSIQRDSEAEKFHLVLGDPTQLQLNGTCKNLIDGHQADKYIAILQLLVDSHGWVFIYTRAVDYAMWEKAFRANGFDPLDYPWPMIRNTATVQTNTSSIPQNITELLIGARKRDIGRPEFQPDTSSSYKRNVSSRKRKFTILDSCSEPTTKLKKRHSREPLRSNERSAEPMAEFIETFCPTHGRVLDAFAGTMETAKACILTPRHCTVLEADNQCFNLSHERLKDFAAVYIGSHQARSNESDTTCIDEGLGRLGNEVEITRHREAANAHNCLHIASDSESETIGDES